MAGKKTTITSSGKKTENEKSKKAQAEIDQMKKKVAADKKKAEEARKKKAEAAETAAAGGDSAKIDADTLKAVGGALAAGLIGSAKAKGKKKAKRTLTLILIVVLAIAALFVYFKYFANKPAAEPVQTLNGGGLVQTNLDFQSAILGESREKQMYVVLEQDVEVESTVSQSLMNLAVFSKTKVIHSTGTGYYAVDLSKLTDASIAVDDAAKTVAVTVPHTILYVVDYDVANSTFDDTDKGFLAIGDLKLTMEQTNEVEKSIDAAMHEVLETPEMFRLADEKGTLMVYELFHPLVSALSEEYTLEILMEDAA